MNRKRIVELLEVDFKNILPAHEGPLIGNGKEKLTKTHGDARSLEFVFVFFDSYNKP
jgi:hypothetical protein